MDKKSFRRDNWPYSAAENLPEYNSVLVGCVTCSTCCLQVRESVEASMIQQTFAWAATFVHKRTLYCIYSTVYIQAKCTQASVFHPAFKIQTVPFLYFSSFSVPPPLPLSFSVFAAAAILAQSGFIATTNMEVLYIHTHTVTPVFAPVEVLFKAHLFQAYELIYLKYQT